jgi:hypothetical protein
VDEQGFTVAMTPGQFAAAVSGGTLDGTPRNWARLWGGAKVLFAGIEAVGAGALLLAPEPTMLTKVGAVALSAYSADLMQSGVRQVVSGQDTRTFTDEGTAALAKALGSSPATARCIGDDVDLAVPLVLSIGLGAVRVAAVRGGRVVLAEHEAATLRGVGGHTMARHVAQTDADLTRRLSATRLGAVSTFTSLEEAEASIRDVLRVNRRAIIRWAKTAPPNNTEAFRAVAGSRGVGRVLVRGSANTVAGRGVKVVLKKEAYNGKLYYILTAHPEA